MVMTHKLAVCDFFEKRSGKYISNRTKMLKAKKNNPLINTNKENTEHSLPEHEEGEKFSILKNIFKKRTSEE